MARKPQGPLKVTVSLSEEQAERLDQVFRNRLAAAGNRAPDRRPTQGEREALAVELLDAALTAVLGS